MSSSPPTATATGKRKATQKPTFPPPLKRTKPANISQNAVANFFTPVSKKPKEKLVWSERAPEGEDDAQATLLVGQYFSKEEEKDESGKPAKRRKIAAFDLDSTLITTASGAKFPKDENDWKWFHPNVPDRLRKLYRDEGYQVVILSNQGGVKLNPDPKKPASNKSRLHTFKQKCAAVLGQLDIPTTIYAATAKDVFRKPRMGMWEEACSDYEISIQNGDLALSLFIGDAGGRVGEGEGKKVRIAKDFSCSDRNLAHNVGIKYLTPEEFFLGEVPRNFERGFDLIKHPFPNEELQTDAPTDVLPFDRRNKQDIVLFCGSPGSGKSTFFWTHLKPLGYERINQDILKTRPKCLKVAGELLSEGSSVAIDNTNPDTAVRAEWISLAQKLKVPIRCVYFATPHAVCEHNDAVRAYGRRNNPENRTRLPELAFHSFKKRLEEPKIEEGFQDVVSVDFKFRGTKEDYEVWGQYWT